MNINLYDYITSEAIAAFVMDTPENKIPYFGETLFPAQKQLGTDISWLKGSNGLPVAIQPSNYDAKARLREKEGFEAVATEMAFFREAMRIGEKDRQQINLLLNNPQQELALPLIRNIFNESARLVEGVRVQAEIMRMQLLIKGKISVVSADGRAKYIYDYGQTNNFKPRQGTAGWGNDTSDPVRDIIAWCDYMETKTGTRPTRLVMNRNTFLKLYESKKIHLMMYPNDNNTNYFVSEAQLKAFVENVTGCSIFVYAKKVANLDNSTGLASTTPVALIEDNKVAIMPSGNLGQTWYGTTPEESDLMTGSDAQVSIVNTGTAITTYKEKHPVNIVTIVSSVMIPSFEAIDYCAVADISAAKTDGSAGDII